MLTAESLGTKVSWGIAVCVAVLLLAGCGRAAHRVGVSTSRVAAKGSVAAVLPAGIKATAQEKLGAAAGDRTAARLKATADRLVRRLDRRHAGGRARGRVNLGASARALAQAHLAAKRAVAVTGCMSRVRAVVRRLRRPSGALIGRLVRGCLDHPSAAVSVRAGVLRARSGS